LNKTNKQEALKITSDVLIILHIEHNHSLTRVLPPLKLYTQIL